MDTSIIKTRHLPGNPLLSDSVIFWKKKKSKQATLRGNGETELWEEVHRLSEPEDIREVVLPRSANARDVRDAGSIPGSGRFLGGGHANPLQYSCLENPHGQRSLAGYSPRGHRVRHN